MNQISDIDILRGIRNRNNKIYKYLYIEVYPKILSYIRKFNGSDDDAKDVFQESLIILYRKACSPGFNMDAPIKNLVFTICRNIWYQRKRETDLFVHNLSILEDEESDYHKTDASINPEEISESLKIGLLQKNFRRLDRFCQLILKLFYKGSSHDTISQRLKISNELSRSRKRECMKKLIKMISDDPGYKKFYDI